MQNGFFKTYGKVILFAFLGISIVAAVIGQNKQNNTLAVYTSTDVVQQETLSDSSSEEDNIETQICADNTYHFSISIPKDWTQVIDHDTVSYTTSLLELRYAWRFSRMIPRLITLPQILSPRQSHKMEKLLKISHEKAHPVMK